MSERLTIVVEGLDDESIVTEMETAVRESFDDLALPGPWHVVVRPSDIGGRWDFSVRGLDVRHVMSIAVPPRLLPSLIPQRLTESPSAHCSARDASSVSPQARRRLAGCGRRKAPRAMGREPRRQARPARPAKMPRRQPTCTCKSLGALAPWRLGDLWDCRR